MKNHTKRTNHLLCLLMAGMLVFLAGCQGKSESNGNEADMEATMAVAQQTAAFSLALTALSADSQSQATAPAADAAPAAGEATPAPQQVLKIFSWSTQIVDDDGDVGLYPWLVLDPAGNPHIVYLDDGNDDTKYASVSDGAWKIDSLDSPNVDGYYPSLVLDGSNNPYICRYVINVALISCTYRIDKTWQVQPFINGVKAADVDMAMSSNGDLQIVLYDTVDSNVKYYRMANGAWSSLIMDNVANESETFSFVLGPNDQPHLAYYAPGQGLKHITTKDGANWETTIVEAGIGIDPDLAIDPYGNPHIAYFDQNLKVLKHAGWDGAAWNIDLVDDEGDEVGRYPSIAIGQDGSVHISYYNYAAGTLKYAYGMDRQFNTYLVDNSEESAGEFSSIAIDQAGNPHIAYYTHVETRLKYAVGTAQ